MTDILNAAFGTSLNGGFTIAIFALTVVALIGARQSRGPLGRFAQNAPAVLTALGVLGTFVGILVGLLAFDVGDISASVPRLLEGMKTAFVTSVVGTGCGILVKIVSEFIIRLGDGDEAKGVEDVVAALHALRGETVQARQEAVAGFERLRSALTGDAESSLVTQLQRFRTDVTDEIKAGRRASAEAMETVTATLNALRGEAAQARQETAAGLERLRSALTGDAESSLVTQLQRLRTDVTDEMKAGRRASAEAMEGVTVEIRQISATLAENTSKAFIQALEAAIRDFNQRITEQFGENFRHLNTAVGRLLEWQETYRQQMIANAEALREGAAGIAAARTGLEAIGAQAGALVRAAADLSSLLDGLGKTRAELDARLAAFRDMADAANGAMPMIQKRIEELTAGFARQVETATLSAQAVGEAAREAQAEQARMLNELSTGYGRLREDAAKVGADLREGAARAAEELRTALGRAVEETQRTSAESIRTVGEQLRRTTDAEFQAIARTLGEQIRRLDEAMVTELNKVLSDLGSQLTSMTRQFVTDYGAITRGLREAAERSRAA